MEIRFLLLKFVDVYFLYPLFFHKIKTLGSMAPSQDPNKPSGWIHPFRIPLIPMQTFVTIASWEAPSTPEIYLFFSTYHSLPRSKKHPNFHPNSTDFREYPPDEKKSPGECFNPVSDRPSRLKTPFKGAKRFIWRLDNRVWDWSFLCRIKISAGGKSRVEMVPGKQTRLVKFHGMEMGF